MSILNDLINVRNLLDATFIQWTRDDYNGRHCVVGCIDVVAYTDHFGEPSKNATSLNEAVHEAARRLHPELRDAERPRADFQDETDRFNSHPAIYVNNHCGKEAILKVLDYAIAQKEDR